MTPIRHVAKYLQAIAFAACLLPLSVKADPYLFTEATHDIETETGIIVTIDNASATSSAQLTTPGLFSQAASSYGTNAALARATGVLATPDKFGAFGLSIWSDSLTVLDGADSGLLTASVTLTGASSGDETGPIYAMLYTVTSPQFLKDWLNDDATYLNDGHLLAPAGTSAALTLWAMDNVLTGTYTFQIPYVKNQPVHITSLLEAGAWGVTSTNVQQALFGISAPVGTTLSTMSGVAYAAAVPESSSLSFWLVGVAWVGYMRYKRKSC